MPHWSKAFPWAAIYFFGFEALRAALEQAGTLDREKVLTALRNVDIQTIGGRLRFYNKGENRNPSFRQIQVAQRLAKSTLRRVLASGIQFAARHDDGD